MDKNLTTQDVADHLELTLARIQQFCREGRLGYKFGGIWIITPDDLEEFKQIPRKTGRPGWRSKCITK